MAFKWTHIQLYVMFNLNLRIVIFLSLRIIGKENPILQDEYVLMCVAYRYTRRIRYIRIPVRECTRGYKVLRLLYSGRGMWVKKPTLLTSDSIRGEATHTASFRRAEFPPSTKSDFAYFSIWYFVRSCLVKMIVEIIPRTQFRDSHKVARISSVKNHTVNPMRSILRRIRIRK